MTVMPANVLLIEPEPAEAASLRHALEGLGVRTSILDADTPEAFRRLLAEGTIDAVVARAGARGFELDSAVELVRSHDPLLPVIVVHVRTDGPTAPTPSAWATIDVERLAHAAHELSPILRRARVLRAAGRRGLARRPAHACLFDKASDAILIADVGSARVIDANPAAVELLGYAGNDLAGRRVDALGGEDWRRACASLAAGTAAWRGDVVLLAADRRPLTCDAWGTLHEVDGIAVAYWHLRDVTSLRDARRAEQRRGQRLQRILDACPDHIAVLGPDGAAEWTAGERLPSPPVPSADWVAHWHADDESGARNALAAAGAGSASRFSARTRDATRSYDVRVAPLEDPDSGQPAVIAVARDMTSLRDAEKRLREREATVRSLLESAPDAIVRVDRDGMIGGLNPAAERLFGRSEPEAAGRPFASLFAGGPDAARVEDLLRAIPDAPVRAAAVGADGAATPVEARFARLGGAEPPAFAAYIRDLRAETELGEAAARHARREELVARVGRHALRERDLAVLVDGVLDAVCSGLQVEAACVFECTERAGAVVLRGRCATGEGEHWHPGHRVVDSGRDTRQPLLASDAHGARASLAGASLQGVTVCSAVEVPIVGAVDQFGVLCAYSARPGAFTPDALEFLDSLASILESAVERRSAEDAALYLTQFDPLTGLPNRALLRDRIQQAIERCERTGGMLAVMVIGLDRFKQVNERFGHAGGDGLLREVAARLQAAAQSPYVLGRLGGDEFVIAWNGFESVDGAGGLGQDVEAALAGPFRIADTTVAVTACRGVTVYPDDGRDVDALIRNAELTVRRAKQVGRNQQAFFEPEFDIRIRRRMQLEGELAEAVSRAEFHLLFQPQVSMRDGAVVGAEALLRWRHPQRGVLAPADFIDVAEQTGLIVDIGRWVLQRACQVAARWHPQLRIAVNVSPAQLRHGGLVADLHAATVGAGLCPSRLELEITENLAVDGGEACLRTLAAIRGTGVQIAIDDFGTGYSSLSYLKRLPIDRVKIDHSFVADIDEARPDEPISRAIIAVSHQLGFSVVAEGVETQRQADFFRHHGCDIVQGFLYARPMTEQQFSSWLRAAPRRQRDCNA